MSGGFASAARQPTTKKRVDFSGLFDWAADHLRLATPRNVVDALMDGSTNAYDYSTVFRDYIPRAQHAVFEQFKRLSDSERMTAAKAWFDNIEPGHLAFRDPLW